MPHITPDRLLRPLLASLLALAPPVAGRAAQGKGARGEAAPATRPVTPEEAVYRADVALAEILLDEPSHEELWRIGRSYRARGDYARAAVLGLTALRGKPNDPVIEYELACTFGLWGQKKLAARYLTLAADHGYWGHPVVADDSDLESIRGTPEFAAALKKIKASFDVESPKHSPGQTVAAPKGNPPAAGWPVVIWLHGFGSSRRDFDDEAKRVSTLGYVGVSLDATEVMGPAAYMWSRQSVEPTHKQIQAALKKLELKVDPKRVYLQGFSQGGMHAARLLADYPDFYRGAIANAPGSPQLMPVAFSDKAPVGAIVLSVGSDEHESLQAAVKKIEALWKSRGRPVRVVRFDGGHQLPPDFGQTLPDTLKFLEEGK